MSALRSDRLPPALLTVFAVLGAFPVVRSLIVPDLNWCYPYITSDSYDWINNGIFWAGAQVAPSLRPPGFPLLIAALWKLGALSFLPVLNFLFLGLSTAALYALLRERYDAWITAVACWFFFANGYVQDLARYLMAETYAAPFLVLAALAFVRSEREPRAWIAFGLFLGVGLLFAYVAVPAGIGFGAAFLVVARKDLRRKELWAGVAALALVVGSWLAFRLWFYRAHPGGPRHGVEALIRPSLANAPFYAYALVALVGLVPIALYVAGGIRLARSPSAPRWRAAVLGPLVAVSLFWLFVYDWADKRFLLYVLPFLVCFLAEGLVLLRDLARRGRAAAAAAAGFLAMALLWNQIRYPSYGFQFLALSPAHFLEPRLTFDSAAKAVVHWDGAQLVRPFGSYAAAWSRGLFDPRRADIGCPVSDLGYSCLAVLKGEADRLLGPGQPVGLVTTLPRGWPSDYWSSTQRLANELLRPVALPGEAEILLAGIELVPAGADVSRPPFLARCGPYVLVRRQ
ncbi:MAG: glycosyltransferase family 39 protein [Acidobacteriota bacterium]